VNLLGVGLLSRYGMPYRVRRSNEFKITTNAIDENDARAES
jgi:hypothetical protein